jgi:hypothetical protein
MGTITNPLFANFVAGANPTGNQIALPGSPQGKSGANSLLPNNAVTATGPVSGNPYDIVPAGTSGAPNFPANTGGGYGSSLNLGAAPGSPTPTNASMAASSPFSFLNAMTPKDQSRMFDSLKKTYGDGIAHMIMDFMTSGAGFNQQAVNNLLASLQPGIQRGEEDLMSQFSASGNRFGSGAQIGLGDYLSRVNLNEGEIVSQMYQSALDNFMNVMMGTGKEVAQNKASSPSILDSILGGLGIAGKAAGGISSAITGANPGADTSILDAIAGAAAF